MKCFLIRINVEIDSHRFKETNVINIDYGLVCKLDNGHCTNDDGRLLWHAYVYFGCALAYFVYRVVHLWAHKKFLVKRTVKQTRFNRVSIKLIFFTPHLRIIVNLFLVVWFQKSFTLILQALDMYNTSYPGMYHYCIRYSAITA